MDTEFTEEQIKNVIECYTEVAKRKLSPENLRRFAIRDLEYFEETAPYRKLAEEIGEDFTGVEVRENTYTDRDFAIMVMKKKVRMFLDKWSRGCFYKVLKHVNLPDLTTLQVNREDKESKFLLLTNDCKSNSFKQDAEAIYHEFPLKYPTNAGAQGMVIFLNNNLDAQLTSVQHEVGESQ